MPEGGCLIDIRLYSLMMDGQNEPASAARWLLLKRIGQTSQGTTSMTKILSLPEVHVIGISIGATLERLALGLATATDAELDNC